jgi:hypothetical protein
MLQHFIQHFIQNFIENKCFKLKKVKQHDYANDNDYHYEVECFICFMPYEENNPIKMLSEFPYIIQKCKCNTNIHLLCLTNWIHKTQSCPICRTKITYFSLLEPKLRKNYMKYILYINAFIILSFNLCLCIYIFIQVLFEIYLYIKL